MKTIVYLITSLGYGGAEVLLKDYCKEINKSLFKVYVIVLGRRRFSTIEDEISSSGIEILYTDRNGNKLSTKVTNRLFRQQTLIRYLKKTRPDIIHSHLSVNRWLLKCGVLLKGKRIFHTVHAPVDVTYIGSKEKDKEKNATNKLVHKYGMKLIAVQHGMKQELEKMFLTDNCDVIYNAIDVNRFKSVSVDIASFKKTIGVPEEAKIICHVGRFTEAKNHNFLINVFKGIKDIYDNCYLILVGDGILKNEIKERIEVLNLSDSVVILSHRDDIPNILHSSDLFLFPSIYESFGLAAIEAQIAGMECVISDRVPMEAVISTKASVLPLGSTQMWIEEAVMKLKYSNKTFKCDYSKFEVTNTVKKLERLYSGEIHD